MNIFNLKLFASKHTRLKYNSHSIALYQTILKVQIFGNRAIYKIIEILFFIRNNNIRNTTYPFGINIRTIQTILLNIRKGYISPFYIQAVRIRNVSTPFILQSLIFGQKQFLRSIFAKVYILLPTLNVQYGNWSISVLVGAS